LSRAVFRVSAGFLVAALALLAASLYLSEHYIEEYQRLSAAGDVTGAMKKAKLAARFDPFDSDALEARAYLLQRQGKDEEAERVLRVAAERNPPDFVSYLALGNIQMYQLNDLDAAVRSYNEALERNPKLILGKSSLAQAYIRQGNQEEARKAYEDLRETNDLTYQGLYDLGRIYVRSGRPEEGVKTIRAAQRRVDDDLRATGQSAAVQGLRVSMDLAIADAFVMQREYGRARRIVSDSPAEQAPAILRLLNTDPEGYRESVANSAIY
jgi:tetratricopeptide (TPR) repeat protein